MSFVTSGISCQSAFDIPTDQYRKTYFSKKILIAIGISIAFIVLCIILITILIYLFTSKQSSGTDTNNYITITVDNISTTTLFQNLSATTTTTTGYSEIKAGQQFGDITGFAFDDSLMENFSLSYYLSGIKSRRNNACLNWIQCFYSLDNITGVIHGIPETTDAGEQFFLDKDEKISKVQVKVDYVQLYVDGNPSEKPRLIIAIRFFTTKGRSSSNIDQIKGDDFTEEFEGYTLGYVTGRSGRYIDQIQFHWYQIINN